MIRLGRYAVSGPADVARSTGRRPCDEATQWRLACSCVGDVMGGCRMGRAGRLNSAEDAARAHIDRALKRSEIYRASMSMSADLRVGDGKPLTDGTTSDPLAYVFDLAPKGHFVVTKDTRLVPVVAYSYTSLFSWEESSQNILLDLLRQDRANPFRTLDDKAIGAEVTEDNEHSWDGLLGDEPPQRYMSRGRYGPRTTNPSWHQGSPYWVECPMDRNELLSRTHRRLDRLAYWE